MMAPRQRSPVTGARHPLLKRTEQNQAQEEEQQQEKEQQEQQKEHETPCRETWPLGQGGKPTIS
jgi:hypothetical protein